MQSVAAKYEFRLKNQAGVVQARFGDWVSLNCTKIVNDVGSFEITFYDNDDARFASFVVDGQVEVWRSVPGCSLDWYREFEGFYRSMKRETSEKGDKLITFSGFDYNHLLARRVIGYRQGTVYAEKDDYVEDCMKEYVNENAGPGASAASRLRNGVFTNFTVEALSASHDDTGEWVGERSFQNLLEVLQQLSDYSWFLTPVTRSVDFAVVNNGAGNFIFRTYLDQLGTDRSVLSANPTIFSIELGNLTNVMYALERSKEINAIMVLGKGEGATRKVRARTNAVDGADSPWNDIEVARAATLNEYLSQLDAFGDSTLQENRYTETIDGTPLQIAGCLYGEHYFLGDKVTFGYEGMEIDKQVSKVTIEIGERQKNEKISIEFKDIEW